MVAFAVSRCRQLNGWHLGSLLLQTVAVPFHLQVLSQVLVQGQLQSLHFVCIMSPHSRAVPENHTKNLYLEEFISCNLKILNKLGLISHIIYF